MGDSPNNNDQNYSSKTNQNFTNNNQTNNQQNTEIHNNNNNDQNFNQRDSDFQNLNQNQVNSELFMDNQNYWFGWWVVCSELTAHCAKTKIIEKNTFSSAIKSLDTSSLIDFTENPEINKNKIRINQNSF